MAFSKSLFQYWNGSAWVTAQTPANNSALISLSLADKQGQPMRLEAKIANKMNNPFSGTLSDAKGNLSGVLSDFQRVRLIDEATRFVLFYGRIYTTDENHDMAYGNVITIQAFDALEELKDNVTDGHTDITINGSGSDTYPTPGSPTTSADRRSGLIKGFISLFSKSGNITFSDTDRFATSAVEFAGTSTEYPLKDSGNKSALAHIAVSAKDDPHTTARKTLTYDYYVDPNFQSTGAVQPEAQFNYFPRGSRPTTPATYGLRVEYPTGGGLTKTGRIQPMMSDYDFERPRAELFTEAACHYIDEGPDTVAGATNKDQGFSVEEKTVKLELIKIKNISAAFTWQGKAIGGGVVGTDSAEYLTGNNAKIQYVSATSGGTDGDPEYALISDVTNSFPNSGTITGQTSGSTFVIVSRPKETYGIVKTARLGATNINNADVIREQAVSRLRRSTDEIIRGRFRMVTKPWYHVETASTTVSSNTITFGGGFNPQSYGFKIGMTVTKVTATGTVQSYGYATAVTSSAVTVGGGMSATVSNGDTVRLYIPVRASNNAYVVNRLVNVPGSDFLITAMDYTEDNGVLNTQLEVVGADSGLGPVQNVVSAVISAVSEQERYTDAATGSTNANSIKLTSVFSQDATNPHTTIDWTAGTLTAGGKTFRITAGTATFNNTDADGWYIYHTGVEGSTGFSTTLVDSYTTSDKNHVLVAWVRINSTSDSSKRLEFKTIGLLNTSNIPDKGDASSSLNEESVSAESGVLSKGVQPFNEDVFLISVGNVIRAVNSDGSGGVVSSFAVSFADSVSTSDDLTISNVTNPVVTLTSGTHGTKNVYIYFKMDVPAGGLFVTMDYNEAVSDTRGLVAIAKRIDDSGTDAMITNLRGGEELARVMKAFDAAAELRKNLDLSTNTTYISASPVAQMGVNLPHGGAANFHGLHLAQQASNSSGPLLGFKPTLAGGGLHAWMDSPVSGTYEDGLQLGSNNKIHVQGTNGIYFSAASDAVTTLWLRSNTGVLFYDADNSHYATLQASATTTASVTYKLPAAGPTSNGQILSSTTGGQMSWVGNAASLTVQEEGSSLATAASTINFVGNGVTASGTGSTKTITISDEHVGDITSVTVTAGTHLSGTATTNSGGHSQTINHLVANGSYHIPVNGAADQLLVYSDTGQATWQDPGDHGTHGGGHTHSSGLDITAGLVTLTGINDVSGNTIEMRTSITPYVNDFYNSGSSSYKWSNIYCTTLTEGSDARIKTDIQDLTNANSLALIDSLRPRSYKRLDNTGETIDVINYGLVAQEVEEALTGLDIDKTKLNLIDLPDTEMITQVIDPDGTEAEVPNPRGLSYSQLIAPLIGAVKELKARIETLEGN